jgi:hypothetical protein
VSSRELSGRKRIRKKNPERICYFLSWDSLFLLLFTGKQRSWIRRSYVDPLTTFPVGEDMEDQAKDNFERIWLDIFHLLPFLFFSKKRKRRKRKRKIENHKFLDFHFSNSLFLLPFFFLLKKKGMGSRRRYR